MRSMFRSRYRSQRKTRLFSSIFMTAVATFIYGTSLIAIAEAAKPFEVKVVAAQDRKYLSQGYYISLIELALEKSEEKYGPYTITRIDESMYQARQFISLNKGLMDVVWSMTSRERESKARAVRIPLLKGLNGFRIFAINKDDVEAFKNIATMNDMKVLLAGQGHDWPDVKILEYNGLRVYNFVKYKDLYKLLELSRIDYFPRNVLEIWHELDTLETEGVTVDEYNLLVYPAPVYFFIRRDNDELADRLTYGLKKAIEDGSFEKLFIEHPTHSEFFQRINISKRRVFYLTNPSLPEGTPIDDETLWFTVDKLIEIEQKLKASAAPKQ